MKRGPAPLPLSALHGTEMAYRHHGCRCAVCRAGNTERKYRRPLRARIAARFERGWKRMGVEMGQRRKSA